MFQFNNGHKFSLKTTETSNAIFNHPDYGPTFGQGYDIYICDDANFNASGANIGFSYKNTAYSYNDIDSQREFSGGCRFKVKGYEVWRVTFK